MISCGGRSRSVPNIPAKTAVNTTAEQDAENLKRTVAELEAKIEQRDRERLENQSALEESQQGQDATTARIEELTKKIEEAKQNSDGNLEELEAELEKAKQEQAEADAKIEALKQQQAELEKEAAKAKAEREALEKAQNDGKKYPVCTTNNNRGFGSSFSCTDGICAKNVQPTANDAKDFSICYCSNPNICGSYPTCTSNGGRGFGNAFSCSGGVCAKNEQPSANDNKDFSICLCADKNNCGA